MLGLVQNTEPTEPAKDAVRMWEQWLGIVLNQSIMILFYRGELYSTLHNSFYFPLPGDTSLYCLPVTGRDFANFAADRVRHSFARIARLQHSMLMDWYARIQPHVYITFLQSPHVAF